MRCKLLILFSFLILPAYMFGQGEGAGDWYVHDRLTENYLLKDNLKDKMLHHNFSKLWMITENAYVYGFIDDNYQRIRVKLISVTKDDHHPGQYNVTGKSMVKNNICDFKGTMNIKAIRKLKKTSYGADDEYKNKGVTGEYTIKGNYLFLENKAQSHSGIFKGSFQSEFYLTKDGKFHYDDINMVSDGYNNNRFVGKWISYNKQIIQTCNWGDYRIPECGDFDEGAGDFSPDDKYISNGWQNLRNAYDGNGPKRVSAQKQENRAWWK